MRIKLYNGNPYFMAKYADADGQVYLDTSAETKAILIRNIEQLTELNKINIEGVLGTALPATPKNQNLIGKSTNLGVYHNDYADFDIQLIHGMMVYAQGSMRVNERKSGSSEQFEVEFLDKSLHWAIQLNKTYLNELPWPGVEYSVSSMWDIMQTGAVYNSGDPGYWFPLVNYGRWNFQNSFIPADFRPWVHVAKAFDLMFCKAGWQYSCPILETETGRRLISYILRENYGQDTRNAEQREFKAGLKKRIQMPDPQRKPVYQIVKFDDEISDPGSAYDPATGIFSKAGIYDFTVELNGTIYIQDDKWGGTRTSVLFGLYHQYVDGTIIALDDHAEVKEEHFFDPFWKETLVASNILVRPGEKIFVRYRGHGDNDSKVGLYQNCVFYNKLISVLPEEGEIFDLQNAVRPDKCLDYLKGITHMFNFKFYTSFTERKVYILTPYDTDFFGDTASGFFLNTLTDFTNLIDYSEAKVSVPHEDKKNYYLKFKKSTDKAIEDLKLDERNEYLSNFIDRGFDFKDETEAMENPYFEATLNGNITGGGIANLIYDGPQCLDNTEGKLSYNIGPRVIIAGGMLEQVFDGDTLPEPILYFNNYNIYATPFAWQKTKAIVMGVSGPAVPENYLAYGKEAKDLYNLFYRRYFNEFLDCLTVNVPIIANYDKVKGYNFRNRALINYQGTGHTGRILSFESYDPEAMTGRIIFKADSTADPACDNYELPAPCDNNPAIIVTDNGSGSYTITAGGTNTSPVASTTIEHKAEDANTWTAGANFTATNKRVTARITWVYSDGCPNQQRTFEVNPCANYPSIGYERTTTEPFKLSVFESGSHKNTVTGVLYEYSINGTTWQVIPVPFLLSELPDQVYLRVTVYYQNCPAKTVQTVYFNNPTPDDCQVDGISVPLPMFVHTPAGLIIEKRGSFNGRVAIDMIKFREAGTDEDWDIYDTKNREILDTEGGKTYEAQRVVIFCNGECPIYCSDITVSNSNCPGVTVTSTDSLSICDINLKYENPDDQTNTWSAAIENDTTFVIPKLRVWMEQDCGGTITDLFDRVIQWDRQNFKTEFSFSWPQNYTVKLMKISKNAAGVQTLTQNVDLNVLYSPGNTNDDLKNKLEAAIQSGMSSQFGAIAGTDYECIVTVTGGGTTKTVSVAFKAKKVVNSTWYGPKKGTDFIRVRSNTNVDTDTTATGLEFQEVVTPAPTVTLYSPCGEKYSVRYKINITSKFINDSASDFDTIVLNSTLTVVEDVLTIKTGTCSKHEYFPNVTGCTTPTYLWKQGEKTIGTDLNITAWGEKKVRFYVSCPDGCTYMQEF